MKCHEGLGALVSHWFSLSAALLSHGCILSLCSVILEAGNMLLFFLLSLSGYFQKFFVPLCY